MIPLSRESYIALELLLATEIGARAASRAILEQATQAANSIVAPLEQAVQDKIQAILEAHDIEDGAYIYDPEKRALVPA